MIIPFLRDDTQGSVTVTLERVDDPTVIGKHPSAHDFPSCTAAVDYPGKGYRALFGWVQLVRSTDNPSAGAAFDMDPFYLFEDAPSPYAFFGINPTLFDAPSRASRDPLDWTAHSFLAWTPMDDTERRVLPLAGFSWGFGIDSAGRITLREVETLAPVDWDAHLPYLGTSHPGWVFEKWQDTLSG
ncbi:hypothetical protein J2Z21_001708 [Streptomyces griseochromogenes]|uniref:Uncharacterized protein n=1 Tax=Streptomyces griseochromogenes TaxID=68214 RepID=A0A1B1B761_9ACTN|nr:hypothetical protein [Streptomyces griseochromogenes]ANP54665.1 hypothetical protein AVL59_38280 [Streptomyces griseochromogenes]MBP2048783.1 hypothetical protein [Streptomyces griseochromogenes]